MSVRHNSRRPARRRVLIVLAGLGLTSATLVGTAAATPPASIAGVSAHTYCPGDTDPLGNPVTRKSVLVTNQNGSGDAVSYQYVITDSSDTQVDNWSGQINSGAQADHGYPDAEAGDTITLYFNDLVTNASQTLTATVGCNTTLAIAPATLSVHQVTRSDCNNAADAGGFQAHIAVNNDTTTTKTVRYFHVLIGSADYKLNLMPQGSSGYSADGGVYDQVNFTPISKSGYTGTATITDAATGGNIIASTPIKIPGCPVPVNQPPVANPDSATVQQLRSVNVDVVANDTDPDGDKVIVNPNTTYDLSPNYGQAASFGPSNIRYTAQDGFVGTVTITYGVSDQEGHLVQEKLTVTVTAPPNSNHPPMANNDTGTVVENGSVNINVVANDTDADGNTLTLLSVANPAHGTAVQTSGSTTSVTYTPTDGYTGTDSFEYSVDDGHGGSGAATVHVTVTAPPAPTSPAPVAKFSITTSDAVTPFTTSVDGSASTGDIVKYDYAWGDNTPDTVQATPVAQHTYTGVGFTVLTLTVTDGQGRTATYSFGITRKAVFVPPPPVANPVICAAVKGKSVASAVSTIKASTKSQIKKGRTGSCTINWDRARKPKTKPRKGYVFVEYVYAQKYEADHSVTTLRTKWHQVSKS